MEQRGATNHLLGNYETNYRFQVENPIRVQYSTDIGVGLIFDIEKFYRINLDVRYSIGHSNMGFNTFDKELNPTGGIGLSPEEGLPRIDDLGYSHDMLTISLGFYIGYNPELQQKGKSTNKASNLKKK